MKLTEPELTDLKKAKDLLENPGLAAKITNYIGMPLEKGFELLPKNWNSKIVELTHKAITKSTDAALFTMKNKPGEKSSNIWHKATVAISGGAGGFFGFAGLAVELPVSTTIMMRSIADIARSENQNLDNAETKLACVEVLALGGKSESDDGTESGYYITRALLAQQLTMAAEHIAKNGLTKEGAPALVKFFTTVASRFGIQVTEKAAAQAVPVIGAATGAALNLLFIDHFQDMARGHFIVKRLEKKYSPEFIKKEYASL
ncbi:EcsC family protein [uncultured Christiangramia sp.]|uniref:EcsC family protein n=1 Tax=uncultured Christiangramia sp. TaxID=503836 RepID=UPI00262DB780|nr:EcsC family protein [uncultured Christiangramia sp.]